MTLATPTRRRLLGVIFSALLVAGLPACQKTSGPQLPAGPYSVAEVFDGDSFNLKAKDGSTVRVRIAGIDAPEKTQPYSNKAKDSLTELLQSGLIGLQPVKVDAYDRWVANVSIGDRDLGLAQIQRGYAWYFVRYKKDISEAQQQRYAEAERSARDTRLGLWAGIDASVRNPALMPEPPWKFRERTRKEK
jgi:endonuclease YncB( thermonuclease family)